MKERDQLKTENKRKFSLSTKYSSQTYDMYRLIDKVNDANAWHDNNNTEGWKWKEVRKKNNV